MSKMAHTNLWMLHLLALLCLGIHPAWCNVEYSSDMPINDEPAEGGSIDEAIVNAANSSKEFEFFYDENAKFLKLEYDIVMSFDEYEAMRQATEDEEDSAAAARKKRTVGLKAGGWGAQRWADNVVHYQFNPDFSGKDINTIKAAIADWERHTCIDFRQSNRARNRIIFKNGGGCYSRLGMVGGTQDIGLADGCRFKGIVIHEIGHALGLHHEQTRPDRDNYIRIIKRNIPPSIYFNFKKQSWKTVMQLGIPYDYSSIMHYGSTAFTTNGQKTIETIQSQYQDKIGNRKGLTYSDIKTMNIMYNCKRHQRGCNKNDGDCPNNGFVDKNCRCVCDGGSISNPTKTCEGGTRPRPTPRPTSRPATPRPTPRPTPPPNQCQDQHRSCSWWASRGECRNNPGYMNLYCKRSCNKCGGGGETTRPECKDSHSACAQWKQMGYCYYRYPHIVKPRCQKSCGVCTSGARDSGTGNAQTNANCRDTNYLCPSWARTGECSRNPRYMLTACKLSCRQCATASNPAAPAVNTRTNANCFDIRNYPCAYWRQTGQCYSNQASMRYYCKRTCGFCS